LKKTILVTGATDGIGLQTATKLLESGHQVLLHGRNLAKLSAVEESVADVAGGGGTEKYVADMSNLREVQALAIEVAEKHSNLDVLINNAGVLKTPVTVTDDGLDIRFAVNTIAPYLLTQRLLPVFSAGARVVNVSSAAQAPVDLQALVQAQPGIDDMSAYAQSKLAITMWSNHMVRSAQKKDLVITSVNPGSLLGSKMVREAFGTEGKDINIGADILCRAALDDQFASASGLYFDNDSGQFGSPHPDALDADKNAKVANAIESVLKKLLV